MFKVLFQVLSIEKIILFSIRVYVFVDTPNSVFHISNIFRTFHEILLDF